MSGEIDREQRLLQNIERLTKQPIAIEKVPSIADLRAAQLEQTVNAIRESLSADDLEEYYPVLHALRADADPRTVALAAVRLFHEMAGNTVDETEIPEFTARPERPRFDRPEGGRTRESGGAPQAGTAFLYVGIGRKGGVRPNDLVGSIANESGLTGREIGPIRITDSYSVVGVPEGRVEHVIKAMSHSVIRGKSASVRRYVDNGPGGSSQDGPKRYDGPRKYDGPKKYDAKSGKRPR